MNAPLPSKVYATAQEHNDNNELAQMDGWRRVQEYCWTWRKGEVSTQSLPDYLTTNPNVITH